MKSVQSFLHNLKVVDRRFVTRTISGTSRLAAKVLASGLATRKRSRWVTVRSKDTIRDQSLEHGKACMFKRDHVVRYYVQDFRDKHKTP